LARGGYSLRCVRTDFGAPTSYVGRTTTSTHMLNAHSLISCLLLLSLVTFSTGFYLPGVAETIYNKTLSPKLKANKLTSTHTQLPFKYYYLPFCSPPKKDLNDATENLGEIIRGDKIEDSVYEV
jgi:hypothetical protein